jgi:hypothetical protein
LEWEHVASSSSDATHARHGHTCEGRWLARPSCRVHISPTHSCSKTEKQLTDNTQNCLKATRSAVPCQHPAPCTSSCRQRPQTP